MSSNTIKSGTRPSNSLTVRASIYINRPLETVSLHLTDQANIKDWLPSNCGGDICEYVPFRKISVIENLGVATIRRTLLFEPVNHHGTQLTYIEEHQLKNLLAILAGPILKAHLFQHLRERLGNIKNLFEKKPPAPWFFSPPKFRFR